MKTLLSLFLLTLILSLARAKTTPEYDSVVSVADTDLLLDWTHDGTQKNATALQFKQYVESSPVFTAPTLGVATATSINGNHVTTGTGTLTLGNATLNAGTGGTLEAPAFASYGTTAGTVAQGNDSRIVAATPITHLAGGVPFRLGPPSLNIVCRGDSITEGAMGTAAYPGPQQGWPAAIQSGPFGQGGCLVYDMGFAQETTQEIGSHYAGGAPVTTTITTTAGNTTATIASATGITTQQTVAAAALSPNTTFSISGTTLTLSKPSISTASGQTCSIFTAPTNVFFGELYPGSWQNGYTGFHGSPHGLSPAITDIPGLEICLMGANDFYTSGTTFTLTCSTVAGDPHLNVTSGTVTGIVNGDVVEATGIPTTPLPAYILSGGGTTNMVMSAPATATGSVTVTVYQPITPTSTWQFWLTTEVTNAHADFYQVMVSKLLPRPSDGTPEIGEVFRQQRNAWIATNAVGADWIIDIPSVMPAFADIHTGNKYFYTDLLHPSALGDAVIGKYVQDQINTYVYLTQLQYNPFAPKLLPDSWHSDNIPKLNANNMFDGTGGRTASSGTPSANLPPTSLIAFTAGSATGTLTGTIPNLAVGDGIQSVNGNLNFFFPIGTTITAMTGNTSGSTITTSSASLLTGAGLSAISTPNTGQPYTQWIKGDLIIGSGTDLSAKRSDVVTFYEAGTGGPFMDGFNWITADGVVNWQFIASAGGTGKTVGGAPLGNMQFGCDPYALIFMSSSGIIMKGQINTTGNVGIGTATASTMTGFDGSKNLVTKTENVDYGGPVTMTSNATSAITFNTAKHNETIYNTSASTLATATITLPATSAPGQIVRYITNGTITTLTLSGTVDIGASPTTLTAPASVAWQCSSNGHWIRLY